MTFDSGPEVMAGKKETPLTKEVGKEYVIGADFNNVLNRDTNAIPSGTKVKLIEQTDLGPVGSKGSYVYKVMEGDFKGTLIDTTIGHAKDNAIVEP